VYNILLQECFLGDYLSQGEYVAAVMAKQHQVFLSLFSVPSHDSS